MLSKRLDRGSAPYPTSNGGHLPRCYLQVTFIWFELPNDEFIAFELSGDDIEFTFQNLGIIDNGGYPWQFVNYEEIPNGRFEAINISFYGTNSNTEIISLHGSDNQYMQYIYFDTILLDSIYVLDNDNINYWSTVFGSGMVTTVDYKTIVTTNSKFNKFLVCTVCDTITFKTLVFINVTFFDKLIHLKGISQSLTINLFIFNNENYGINTEEISDSLIFANYSGTVNKKRFCIDCRWLWFVNG